MEPDALMLPPDGEEAPMDDTELQAQVAGLVEDAMDYIDGTVAGIREELMQLYKGELPLKPEEDENRSGLTTRDVRDTVEMLMPDVMRVFFSSDVVAEFVPQGPEDVPVAEQATDYVNYVVLKQNNGFLVLYAAIKDALSVKAGFVKTWWDTKIEVKECAYTGLDEAALQVIQAELGPESSARVTGQGSILGPDGVEIPTFDVTVSERTNRGKVMVAAVPPEEFFMDRRATCIEDAIVHGQRQYLPAHEVVAMGVPKEVVMDFIGASDTFEQNQERFVRNPASEFPFGSELDEMNRNVLYVEAYVRLDTDRDGIAEFYKAICLGSLYKLVSIEPWDKSPFSQFSSIPTPHTFFGECPADLSADIQVNKSGLWRAMLDSLAQSVRPRTAVVEGMVNMKDLLSNDVGGIVRMRAVGMAQPLDTPFVGQQVLPVLALLDEMRENRTGVSKAAAGLDADALQSSTRDAVSATIGKAQAQVEMLCRVMAETGWRTMIGNVYHLLKKHQDRELMVKLRNQWVPVDPRMWPEHADISVNLALGRGSENVRMGHLMQIAAEQKAILVTLGPQNPLTDLQKYRYTLAQMVTLAGFKDPSAFWNDPATWQGDAAGAGGPKEDPAMVVAKADAEKKHKEAETDEFRAKSDADVKRDDLKIKALKMCAETGYDPIAVLQFLFMPTGDGGTSVAGGAPGVTPVPELPVAPPQPGNPMAPQPPQQGPMQ